MKLYLVYCIWSCYDLGYPSIESVEQIFNNEEDAKEFVRKKNTGTDGGWSYMEANAEIHLR